MNDVRPADAIENPAADRPGWEAGLEWCCVAVFCFAASRFGLLFLIPAVLFVVALLPPRDQTGERSTTLTLRAALTGGQTEQWRRWLLIGLLVAIVLAAAVRLGEIAQGAAIGHAGSSLERWGALVLTSYLPVRYLLSAGVNRDFGHALVGLAGLAAAIAAFLLDLVWLDAVALFALVFGLAWFCTAGFHRESRSRS